MQPTPRRCKDMQFVHEGTGRARAISQRCRAARKSPAISCDAILEEAAQVRIRRARAAQRSGDRKARDGTTATSRRRRASRTRTGSSSKAAGTALHVDAAISAGRACRSSSRRRCEEMWNSAEHGFCALPAAHAGRDRGASCRRLRELKATYLPKMISGEWTGTMNLTEPQAGLRPRAGAHARRAAGRWHVPVSRARRSSSPTASTTMAENIVHLVLARTPDAPEGVKGISLFVVPKFLVERRRHASASATTCSASRSSTSSASTRARPRARVRRSRTARSATSSARRTAASSTCSS